MKQRYLYIPLAALFAMLSVQYSDHLPKFAFETVAGEALAPYQYRVLFAYLFYGMTSVAGLVPAIFLFWFGSFAAFAYLMDEWLQEWTNEDRAFAWTLVSLIVARSAFWWHRAGMMWSALETIFMLAALLLLRRKRYGWLLPLVFVATLNRETAVFIVLLTAVVTRRWKLTGALGIVWAVTYGAIRLAYGPVPVHVTLADIWGYNTDPLWIAYVALAVAVFGWLPVAAARAWRDAPQMLRRAAWIVPPYLALVAVFGIWREIRLFLPLLPIAVALILTKTNTKQGVTW